MSEAEYQAMRLETKARYFEEAAEDNPALAGEAAEAALQARVQAERLRRRGES
jgi:hypothetical protein